jgi:hypothetical protein
VGRNVDYLKVIIEELGENITGDYLAFDEKKTYKHTHTCEHLSAGRMTDVMGNERKKIKLIPVRSRNKSE